MDMNKFLKISVAVAATALIASCAKEPQAQENMEGYVLREYSAIAVDTKTAISDGHTVWTANDQIKVYFGPEQSSVAKLKTGEGTSSATYEVRVPETANAFYAVYPASVESALVSDDSLSVVIPSVQAGQFAAGHIAVAKADQNVFSFANVNSFLKIQIATAKYTRITVESVGAEPLAGTLGVSIKEGVAVAGNAVNCSSSVEIVSSTPLAAGDYYISVLPGVTHSKGLVVKYYRDDLLQGTYFIDKEVSTIASKILSFGEFEPSKDYFVTATGAGTKSGTSWANAMDASRLKTLLSVPADDQDMKAAKIAALNGTTINLAAGDYDMGELVEIAFPGEETPVAISFVGGYPAQGGASADASVNTSAITGSDSHRLLVIGEGAKVSFTGVAFTHSLTTVSGEPAMIFAKGSQVSMTNCKVTDNVNNNGTKYSTCAGISVQADVPVSFIGCEFARNAASWGASLILRGDATVKNCDFHDNQGVNGPGNSLYVDSSTANVLVENCTFSNNRGSDTHGGAVGATGGLLTMNNCTFTGNVQSNKNGGAIRLWNSAKAVLNNCTMKDNHANYGGAIYLENKSEIDLVGGLYEANYAKGGGLINASSSSIVKISSNAVVKGNYATNGHGGAILADAGKVEVENVTFSENINKTTSSGIFGAAIATTGEATVLVDNCTFKGNHSDCYGGSAINLQATATMTLTNSLFEGNFNEAKGIASGNNNGNYGGGALRLNTKGKVTVQDCVFRNNNVATFTDYNHTYGGAVYINTGGTFMFDRCLFEDNFSTRGGALCTWATDAKVYLNACAFTGNWISHRYGTTIHIEKAGEFCMNNCSIADNTYTTGGTGDWQSCWLNLSTITAGICISNCSFIGSPRTGASASVNTSANSAIVRFDELGSDNNYFINDIIVTNETVGKNRSLANYNKAITLVYTKRSDNSANSAGGSLTAVESPASNGFAATSEYFENLQWQAGNSAASNYWKWSGNMLQGGNLAKCTASIATQYIGTASAGFKTWLEAIGALSKDQLGNERGTGDWWPGAYQQPM